MNNLDDLIDRINEFFTMVWSRIEENSTFNTVREKYETLSSSAQRLVIVGSIAFLILVIFSIPLSSLFSSSSYVSEFEEKKTLVEGLLNAEQALKKSPPIPPGLNASALQNQVTNQVQSRIVLIDGQGPEIVPLAGKPAGRLAPAVLEQAAIQVSFKGLNLQQTADVGAMFESIHPSVKILGLDVQASSQFPKYYDVVYRLVSFTYPQVAPPASTEKARGNRDSRPSRRRGN